MNNSPVRRWADVKDREDISHYQDFSMGFLKIKRCGDVKM
jgi:hypothetical protein